MYQDEVVVDKEYGYLIRSYSMLPKATVKLIMFRLNKSYIQNLHSERSVEQFVDIIDNVDFMGNRDFLIY